MVRKVEVFRVRRLDMGTQTPIGARRGIAADPGKERLRQSLRNEGKRRGQAIRPDAECSGRVDPGRSQALSRSARANAGNGLTDSRALQWNLNQVDPVHARVDPVVTAAQ